MVFHETIFSFHVTTSPSHSSVLPNLVLDLDHQNSTFPTTLPNSQSASLTSPSEPIPEPIPTEPITEPVHIEPIIELIPIELIPEPVTTESLAPNSFLDFSTQPLRHYTRLKDPPAWHKDYLLSPRANQSSPIQGSPKYTIPTFSFYFLFQLVFCSLHFFS